MTIVGNGGAKITARVSQKLGEMLSGAEPEEFFVASRADQEEICEDWTHLHCLFRYKIHKLEHLPFQILYQRKVCTVSFYHI